MARGNLFQGYAQGKLGSTIFSISHGVQVSRAYNPSKFDRKSDAQIIRRSQWTAASLYYSHAVASAFKFAYEYKKANDSYQNAFMKANWNRGILMRYEDTINPNYPSVGEYIVSNGTLRPIETYFATGGYAYYIIPKFDTNAAIVSTLGYLSKCMVAAGYKNGDIVTITLVSTDSEPGNAEMPIVVGSNPPQYTFIQFVLDVNSNVSLTSLGLSMSNSQPGVETGQVAVCTTQVVNTTKIGGACVQVSRQTKSKLLVNYSKLTLNTAAKSAKMYSQSLTWRQVVIDSWQSTGNALLQGSDSETLTPNGVLEMTADLTFPRTWASLDGRALVFNKIITAAQFSERFIFYQDANTIYRAIPQEDGSIGFLPKTNGQWIGTARQDQSDPYRWVISSSNQSRNIAGYIIDNDV